MSLLVVGQSFGGLYVAETEGINQANGQRVFVQRHGTRVQYNHAAAVASRRTKVSDGTVSRAANQVADAAVTLAPLKQTDLIDAVLPERRIELLGEGLRSKDLLRLGATIPAKGSAPAVPQTAAQYIWPIPVSELPANREAVQNAGD